MKPLHFVPVGLALGVLVYWGISQQKTGRKLATETEALQQQIETTQRSRTATEQLKTKLKSPGQALDWKNLGVRLVAAQEEDSPLLDEAVESFKERLAKMSTQEILAALEQISAPGLEAEAKALLEEMLVEALILRDPAQALAKFADRIQDESDRVGWQLGKALGDWAKRDVKAASAWFDKEIAAGRFESKSLDGQSEARLEFEAALLHAVLTATPKDAAARLAALPEDQRRSVLEQLETADFSPAARLAYVELLRQQVPKAEQASALGHLISEMEPAGDYGQITALLDSIKATPEERAVVTKAAAVRQFEEIATERPVNQQDLDKMRVWLKKQAPDTADQVIGEAVGLAIDEDSSFTFTEAYKLLVPQAPGTAKDALISSFIKTVTGGKVDPRVGCVAGKIQDPKLLKEAMDLVKQSELK